MVKNREDSSIDKNAEFAKFLEKQSAKIREESPNAPPSPSSIKKRVLKMWKSLHAETGES
jgi:hypothetical protein